MAKLNETGDVVSDQTKKNVLKLKCANCQKRIEPKEMVNLQVNWERLEKLNQKMAEDPDVFQLRYATPQLCHACRVLWEDHKIGKNDDFKAFNGLRSLARATPKEKAERLAEYLSSDPEEKTRASAYLEELLKILASDPSNADSGQV